MYTASAVLENSAKPKYAWHRHLTVQWVAVDNVGFWIRFCDSHKILLWYFEGKKKLKCEAFPLFAVEPRNSNAIIDWPLIYKLMKSIIFALDRSTAGARFNAGRTNKLQHQESCQARSRPFNSLVRFHHFNNSLALPGPAHPLGPESEGLSAS